MTTLKYANKAEYGSKMSYHGKKASVSKVSGNKDCIIYMYILEVSSRFCCGLCANFVSDFCHSFAMICFHYLILCNDMVTHDKL